MAKTARVPETTWVARVFTQWGTALAAGSDEAVSLVQRNRRRHRATIASSALHQGVAFALAHPWIAEEMVEHAGAFLSPEYREGLRKSLEDVAREATFQRADDLAAK